MTKLFEDIDIIILPNEHINSSICISLQKNPKFEKSFSAPNFFDLDELDEILDITLGIFQVMIIKHLAIKKSTEFAL